MKAVAAEAESKPRGRTQISPPRLGNTEPRAATRCQPGSDSASDSLGPEAGSSRATRTAHHLAKLALAGRGNVAMRASAKTFGSGVGIVDA